ncbi:MAG TPA: ParB/RepB/Spo0J family partition protein [Pirellulales bacterium]|jgi:ParB family chromosome partitioning protein
MNANIVLSKVVPGKVNPRRVKPDREAHRKLVASIKSFGLLEPLVVRPVGKRFQVIAGNRRLAALCEVHQQEKNTIKIPCMVREADDVSAEALSLAENFAREGMHPLDEAETFARLAGEEGKDAESIAAQFGVKDHYVRQRMKLATLANPIKTAYREGTIDTGTAEVFTSVPKERQLTVWQELNGHPRHAEQVRNVIAAAWIDAGNAVFDVSILSPAAVSRDLFGQRVLVERAAFMEAQATALVQEREALTEDGWKEVIIGPKADVQDRLWSMTEAQVEYDEETIRKLVAIDKRWERVEGKIAKVPEEDMDRAAALQGELDALNAEAGKLHSEAPRKYSEATKAKGTVFLMLDLDGSVCREYRVPKQAKGVNGSEGKGPDDGTALAPDAPPTAGDLSDRQLVTTFTQQAIAVRQAILEQRLVGKRVLVLILHDRIRSEALSIRHDANSTTVHADRTEGFASPALTALRKRRAEIDPFIKKAPHNDVESYERLCKLSEEKLDALIELLTAECLSAHMSRRTALIERLAGELDVNMREVWRPDAAWLSSYQKVQLADLIGELRGGVMHRPSDDRKKTELVLSLEKLFADAAEGKLEDAKLAETVNRWLPSNLRPEAKAK